MSKNGSAVKQDSKTQKQSLWDTALSFLAINCIIVSVLTFALTIVAVLTSNYDKWFPLAVVLSITLFIFGRWLFRRQRRK